MHEGVAVTNFDQMWTTNASIAHFSYGQGEEMSIAKPCAELDLQLAVQAPRAFC